MENNLRLKKAAHIQFIESAEYQRIINKAKHKLRPKIFVEKFKSLNIIAVIGTVFFPLISVLTGIAFLYNYINDAINITYLSIAISLAILSLLESVKNNLLNNGLHTYFSNSGKSILIFAFALVFSIGSFIMSYQGAELLVLKLDKSKQEIVKGTQGSITDIKQEYANSITEEKRKIADLNSKAKKQWRGLQTPEQNKLILAYEQNIKQYRIQEQKDIDLALANKKENITQAETSINYNAYVFKVFAGINEFLTILSIAFVAFYAFKTVRQDMDLADFKESPNKYKELPGTTEFKPLAAEALPKHSLNTVDNRNIVKGFLRPNVTGRNNDTINNDTKACKYCGNQFKPYNVIHAFCSKECRMIWHKENNGFELEKYLKKSKKQ